MSRPRCAVLGATLPPRGDPRLQGRRPRPGTGISPLPRRGGAHGATTQDRAGGGPALNSHAAEPRPWPPDWLPAALLLRLLPCRGDPSSRAALSHAADAMRRTPLPPDCSAETPRCAARRFGSWRPRSRASAGTTPCPSSSARTPSSRSSPTPASKGSAASVTTQTTPSTGTLPSARATLSRSSSGKTPSCGKSFTIYVRAVSGHTHPRPTPSSTTLSGTWQGKPPDFRSSSCWAGLPRRSGRAYSGQHVMYVIKT